MSGYRVFVSYSHEDTEIAKKIVEALELAGLTIMWDKNLPVAQPFSDQIRNFISYSHVFLPIITPKASKRGWVHEEIGYAFALGVPILPVAVGTLPTEMIRELQGIKLGVDPSELSSKLSLKVFDNLLKSYRDASAALYVCAEFHDDRSIMMAKYANDVLMLEETLNRQPTGMVRQKGGLSSFHIPDDIITHEAWGKRFGALPKGDYHKKQLREERIALGKHAELAGCRIIVDPSITYDEYGQEARLTRLQTLLEFLKKMPSDKVQIAFNYEMDKEESVTIVGDWFAAVAMSRSSHQGYRQTIFTRHAPSMQTRIDLFDNEFHGLIKQSGWEAESSRENAIADIETIVSDLKNKIEGKKKKPTVRKPRHGTR